MAAESGADVIKSQIHIPDSEMSSEAGQLVTPYLGGSIYDLIRDCALSIDEEFMLKEHIHSLGKEYLATPFSVEALNHLIQFGVDTIKIGSGESMNLPFMEIVANANKNLLVSTGMAGFAEIDVIYEMLCERLVNFGFLHTTNSYPTPPDAVRLGVLAKMRERYPGVIVGLSDHTVNNLSSYVALGLGAKVIERHFTDTRDRCGPDISNSMTPDELRDLVSAAADIPAMLGEEKFCHPVERDVAIFARQSVVATMDIHPGDVLGPNNIWLMRPGNGDFLHNDYKNLFGKRVGVAVAKGTQLRKSDVQ
jgi:sialic acid synthase SpsE